MKMVKENQRERFKRLATSRTNIVLKRLDVLGNCANIYAYDYTEEDVKKIFTAIEQRIKEVKLKFNSGLAATNKKATFKL